MTQLWIIGVLGHPHRLKLPPLDNGQIHKRLNGEYYMSELADVGEFGEHYNDVDLYKTEADAWRASIKHSAENLRRVKEQHEHLVQFATAHGFDI
jgi:hypothetical protein